MSSSVKLVALEGKPTVGKMLTAVVGTILPFPYEIVCFVRTICVYCLVFRTNFLQLIVKLSNN